MSDAPKNPGVCCAKCGCRHLPTLDTRRQGRWTVRRRQCRHCYHIMRTREEAVQTEKFSPEN